MNPWGSEKYNGPWNNNDSRWTPEYKRQVNLVVADDGIFWMPIQDVFRQTFQEFTINMYEDWKVDTFAMVPTVAQKITFEVRSSYLQDAALTVRYQK